MVSTSKSTLAVAREALAAGTRALPAYSNRFSRRDFTQAQLFAVVTVKHFMQLDYRGVAQLLSEWSELRQCLKLPRVPHYSTLCYAERRLFKKGAS